jgi:ATP-dependent RNA helicase DeaD
LVIDLRENLQSPVGARLTLPRGAAGKQPGILKPLTPAPVSPVATRGPLVEGFRHLELSASTLAAIAAMGWQRPTPIQEAAIPLLLAGRDVVGRARTGTGKTGAFALPLIERLDPTDPSVQAIVLVPTRELAVQVTSEIDRLGSGSGLRAVAVYGGQSIRTQLAALARGAQIVVGTPGRVQDHMQRGTLRLDRVRVAVLDEADEMLDIGFADDMERILRHTPRERQTALFSATLPPFIRRMIIRYMRDPAWVDVIEPEAAPTVETVEQIAYLVSERDKVDAFVEIYNDIADDPRILVFRRTQIGVDRLTAALKRRGGAVAGLHGGMRQSERERVMAAFKSGAIDVLVATNVAARGLDIPDVTHVVNFDLPQSAEEYVHRIGRTARAGKRGTAITFVGEWDLDAWAQMCAELGIAPRQGTLRLYQPDGVADDTREVG